MAYAESPPLHGGGQQVPSCCSRRQFACLLACRTLVAVVWLVLSLTCSAGHELQSLVEVPLCASSMMKGGLLATCALLPLLALLHAWCKF